MTQGDAQRFNLVFAGQLLPGTDPARARNILAAFFRRKDLESVEIFFSGRPLPLRRNLLYKDARELQSQLRQHGLICETPSVDQEYAAAPAVPAAEKPRHRVRAGAAGHEDTGSAAPQERVAVPPSESAAPASPKSAAAPRARPVQAALPRGPAPNLFALRPALSSRPGARDRERQQLRALLAGAFALALMVAVAAVALRFPPAPAGAEPIGPLATASGARGDLLMLLPAKLLIHERSGLPGRSIAAAALGIEQLAPPLLVASDGDLVLGTVEAAGAHGLLRCDPATLACGRIAEGFLSRTPPAVVESYLGDALFLRATDGRFLRHDASGTTLAATALPASVTPRLAYHDGLLLAPAADAPLLGVYRPDTSRFGAQIDALLLAPARDDGDPVVRIRDIALVGEARFAILESAAGAAVLYRFDRQWGAAQRIAEAVTAGAYLAVWRDRLLLADPGRGVALRFTVDGRREADFTSAMLAGERTAWQQAVRERRMLRRAGIVLPLSLAAFALLFALLEAGVLRGMASLRHGSTGLLDPLPGGIHWLPPAERRPAGTARIGVALIVAALLPMVLAFAAGAWLAAVCLLPAVLASLYARAALDRGSGGHLGLCGDDVILIDHDGRYFYGRQQLLQRGIGFLFAPGVALPVAVKGLPTVTAGGTATATAASLDAAGSLGLLWQLRHPWFKALLAVVGGVLASCLCWLFVT